MQLPRALLVLTLSACSSADPNEVIEALPFATAVPDCGPADGPAVTVYLTGSPVDSVTAARFVEPTRPYVRMSFYDASDRLNGRRFTVRPEPAWGWVELCPTSGACAPYGNGWVRLEAVGPGLGIRGSLSMDGPRTGSLRGRFEGTWRDRRMLCG